MKKSDKALTRAELEGPSQKLSFLDLVTIPASDETFVAKDRFKVDTNDGALVKISFIGVDFNSWFSDKTEEPSGAVELCRHELVLDAWNKEIIDELGGEKKAETTLSDVYALIKNKASGQPIPLLVRYPNIFYIRDVNNVLRTVYVICHDDVFLIYARLFEDSYVMMIAGSQVFSRNS